MTQPQITVYTPQGARFAASYLEIVREEGVKKKEWVSMLIEQGVTAAHPDDGWVNRQLNKVLLCYPDFNHGVAVGSIIALGTHERYRLVRVTAVHHSRLDQITYSFESIL